MTLLKFTKKQGLNLSRDLEKTQEKDKATYCISAVMVKSANWKAKPINTKLGQYLEQNTPVYEIPV